MSDTSFLDYVLGQLAGARRVSMRPMFGGHGLYLEGAFFGIVHAGALYFRTDAASRAQYVQAGSRPFNPRGRKELHRYYQVPVEILDDPQALTAWALQAARTGK
ncbi:MAG: TfoX/Sxy family protein [Gammaproteobacteria bacterium]|nr:TfoX/Sxy family protein [Gammaproteobacteria bacterium]